MPKCTKDRIDFGRFGRRVIEADFSGGDLSSGGGLLLLRQVDRHLGLSRMAAAAIPDPRDPERIRHGLGDLLAQRLYALCCGYEDLNDHKALRDERADADRGRARCGAGLGAHVQPAGEPGYTRLVYLFELPAVLTMLFGHFDASTNLELLALGRGHDDHVGAPADVRFPRAAIGGSDGGSSGRRCGHRFGRGQPVCRRCSSPGKLG